MSITWKRGNLLSSEAEILVNPVNCVGVSGAGLAKQFAHQFPEATRVYESWCRKGMMRIGVVWVHEPVLYFPTKIHWRDPSKVEYIERGLRFFRDDFTWEPYASYAFPPLGCGLGGLKWEKVKPLLVQYLGDLNVEIEVYEPNANARFPVSQRPRIRTDRTQVRSRSDH
jgi:O-acetyl-ADP-ribose deacetylase (regulator of RNase III)